jgi:hypothetical protein
MILLKSTSDRTAMWHSLPTEKLVDMRKRWMDQFSRPYPLSGLLGEILDASDVTPPKRNRSTKPR